MPRNLLAICQEALDDTGIDPPVAIVSGGDLGTQLLALANTTGRDIARRGNWQELVVEGSFTTLAAETQVTLTTTFPYIRKIIENTMWNQTQQRRLIGSISAQAWQRIQSDNASSASLVYRIRGDKIIFPSDTAVAGETVQFEYIDTRWCANSDRSSLYESFQADTDIPRISDEAMVMGIRWRFLKAKGLEYGEEFRSYEDIIAERLGNNQPYQNISLNPNQRSEGFDTQIPDGSWNQ